MCADFTHALTILDRGHKHPEFGISVYLGVLDSKSHRIKENTSFIL